MMHEALTVRTHNDTDVDIVGTSLQGYLMLPRTKLVELFGEPQVGPDYKSAYEWSLLINDGEEDRVIAIYDWRTTGANRDTFDDWHIGARDRQDVYMFGDLLIELGVVDPDTVWSVVKPR